MVGLFYLLVGVAVFLPTLLSPADWTGTEGRRVQVALEMLQHGDWLVPTLGGEPTLSKPPLHYWVLAAVARTLGTQAWMLRLPGPIAFCLLAWLAHTLVRRSYGRAAAYCAGLGTLLSPLAMVLVPRAEIDPLFAALSAAAILLLAHGAAFASTFGLLAGGLVGGVALLVKGPPFLMLLAGTMAVWIRRRRGRGLLRALLAMAILPACYYGALTRAFASDTLLDVAATESFARVTLFDLEHVLDTPLHFLRAIAASLPFGLFLFFEYRGERPAEPDHSEAFLRMLAGAAFSTVLVLTVFPARPPRYLLPAVPLFFIAVSPSVAAFCHVPVLPKLVCGIVRGLALTAAIGLCATPWLPAPIGACTGVGLVAVATLPLWVNNGRRVVWAMLALPVVVAWTFLASFAEHRAQWREPSAQAGVALRRALQARAATDLATLLHVPSPLLLHAGVLPPGDELAQREPSARWLLMEADARPQEAWQHVVRATLPPKDYEPRLRLQLPRLAVVLWERR